ncbi:MAG: hypothetical protein L3K26_11435, partial [Candidatus Hydrogenedentes bacterium]|nr:hypothetical protein [Candidatus Hydrogenedentota bacterium]
MLSRSTARFPWLAHILCTSLFFLFFSNTASATTVPFTVENFIEVAQPHYFVQGGIPLPKGHAMPDAPFTVTDATGAVVEAEVKVTAFWPDGSVKWVLVRM